MLSRIPHKPSHKRRTVPAWHRAAFEALTHYLVACERAELVREQTKAADSRIEHTGDKTKAIKAGLKAVRWLAAQDGWDRLSGKPAVRHRRFVAALDIIEATAAEWIAANTFPKPRASRGQPVKALTTERQPLTIAEAFAPVRRDFDVSPLALADYILDLLPTLPASAASFLLGSRTRAGFDADTPIAVMQQQRRSKRAEAAEDERHRLAKRLRLPT